MKHKHGMALHILLDGSGSMCEAIDATISGFNELILQLQQVIVPPIVTLASFGSCKVTKLVDHQPAYMVPTLTNRMYFANGGTPLVAALDASVEQLDKTDARHKVIVVMTDGGDDHGYSNERMRAILEKRQADGWLVFYLADKNDPMAMKMGENLGVPAAYRLAYTARNIPSVMKAAADAIIRFGGTDDPKVAAFTDAERKAVL